MAEDDAEEPTDEEVEATLLKWLSDEIEEVLDEDEAPPFTLNEVKTTRSGRVVAYFDWDLDEDEDEEED